MSAEETNGQVAIADVDNLDSVLQKLIDSVDELEDQVGDMDEEIAELRRQVEINTTDPRDVEYQHLSRDEKVSIIQAGLVEDAKASNGRAAWGYKAVIQRLDGRPSGSHAYKLMELAGQRQGFDFGTSPATNQKRLTVDLADGKLDDPLFS